MTEPFLARLPKGEDLLDALTQAFRDRLITKASFSLIGAVSRAVLGYYDPVSREYKEQEFQGPLEVVSCVGNVSEREGEVFVHAHAVLGTEDFDCVGGHLMPGTTIFAAELHGIPLPGPVPVREFDEATGLALWSKT
jgi:predicted DNA-binding protein with PD1-like motif